MFQNFTEGVGGACERYDPPRSPWCSADFYLLRQFPEMHTRSPAGLRATPHLPHAASYASASRVGAKVHAWRPGHWYTWMWEVGAGTEPGENHTRWKIHRASNAVSGRVPNPHDSTDTIKYLGDFTSVDACWCAHTHAPRATRHAPHRQASARLAGTRATPRLRDAAPSRGTKPAFLTLRGRRAATACSTTRGRMSRSPE